MFSNLRSLIFKLDPETAHNLAKINSQEIHWEI